MIMKKLYIYLIVLLIGGTSLTAVAQAPRIPEASPTQTIIQDFGLGKVTITYSRPSVKGRVIFGGINPYGQVWRTGANAATTLTFSENAIVEGHSVLAGTYSLFTIPEKNEWTVILNKTAKQWGAYSYKEAEDYLRFKVKPIYLAEKRESFTIQFANVTTSSADLHLVWDHTEIAIHLKTDDDALITANIDELMKGNRKPYYFNAIQYYYENNKDMNKALEWALEAEKTDPKGPWYRLWEARIRLKIGDKAAAIKAAQKGIDLAKASNDEEYVRLNQAVLDQANR
jgi:tetratricopeptide (TPR) repeat protein